MQCPAIISVQQTFCELPINPILIDNILEACKEIICRVPGSWYKFGFEVYLERLEARDYCLATKAITELNPTVEFNPGMLKTIISVLNSTISQPFFSDKNSDSCTIFSAAISDFNNRLKQEPETSGLVDRISSTFELFSSSICALKDCAPEVAKMLQEKMDALCPKFSIGSKVSNFQTSIESFKTNHETSEISPHPLNNFIAWLGISIIIYGGILLAIKWRRRR